MNVDETVRRSLWHFPALYDSRIQVLEHLLCTINGGYDWNGGERVACTDHAEHERRRPHHTDPRMYVAAALSAELEEWLTDHIDVHRRTDPDTGRLEGWTLTCREPSDRPLRWLHPALAEHGIAQLRARADAECARVREIRENLDRYATEPGSLLRRRFDPATSSWHPDPHQRSDREEIYPLNERYAALANLPDDITDDWLAAAEEVARKIIAIDGWSWDQGNPEFGERQRRTNLQIAHRALERIAGLRADRPPASG